MKLTAFHAGDGDCLLLAAADGKKHVLIDGGREGSFTANTREALAALRTANRKLDVVYVSHIDDDHITGVLRLVEDIVEWRAFEFRKSLDPQAKPPPFPRPPEIGEVWHNGLFVLIGDKLAPEVQHVLATVATVLAGSSEDAIRKVAAELSDLATGERASMELSRRLSPEQLDIPLNPPANGLLMKRRGSGAKKPDEVIEVGKLAFHLLGPSQDDIDKLRARWEDWIADNRKALRKLQAEMLADEERIGALAPGFVVNPIEAGLGDGLKTVTAANLASLMFLVEEGGKSVLLTGDGASAEIIEGLKRHGKLDANGRIHVDVLKVQHHGAEGNVTEEFVNTVTADHYVFCGNGAHHNPERSVVEGFAKARLTGIGGKPKVGPNKKFTFWFTSSARTPDTTQKKTRRKHMQMIEKLVADLQATTNRLEATFIDDGQLDIVL